MSVFTIYDGPKPSDDGGWDIALAFIMPAQLAANINAPVWGTWDMYSIGVVGVSFTQQWWLSNAAQPTTYSILSGSLPPGLFLTSPSGNQGQIAGTPTTAGTYGFTIRATNAYGSADQAFTIIVSTATGGGSFMFVG